MRDASDWKNESDPDIRLYLFRLDEWRNRRRPAPPCPETHRRAVAAEERMVMDGTYDR